MATELAKAYVQIIPSMQGIKEKLREEIDGSGAAEESGKSFGGKLTSAIKKAVTTAAIGKTIKESVMSGADLQQSVGGVETLLKDSAQTVIQYANNAYQTAGMSANQYMEQVTSFSASLLQSLGGDTAKAAESANQALVDMSDNANKFGTNMEDIQNAYQGFAKQNYTMLDNLKLGYGGTKEEMQRLLNDAQKLTGVKYDISNLNDVYSAIHVIQENLGVTGTTAKEAATTFSGSFASMKSAATNLLATISLGDQATMSVSDSAKALVSTAKTFLVGNLVPMLGNIAKSLPELFTTVTAEIGTELINGLPQIALSAQGIVQSISDGIITGLPQLLTGAESIASSLSEGIATYLPVLYQNGFDILTNIASGILSNIPSILTTAGTIAMELVNGLGAAMPQILASGGDMLLNVASGILNNLPTIVTTAGSVVANLAASFAQNLPALLQSGIEMIGKVAAGLIRGVPSLIAKIPSIISSIKKSFTDIDWGSVGKNIIEGIANGLRNAGSLIVDAAKEAAKSALNAAKNFLGIHSPSRVFDKEVGQMVPPGMANGILKRAGVVTNAMDKLRALTLGSFDGTYAKVANRTYESVPGGQGSDASEIVKLLYAIIALLEKIWDKDPSIVLNDRTLTRALRELGVVFQ